MFTGICARIENLGTNPLIYRCQHTGPKDNICKSKEPNYE